MSQAKNGASSKEKIKKIIYVFIVILMASMSVKTAVSQDEDCNKTKVAVSVEIVDKTDHYNFLENDFGPRANSEWNGFVADMLVQILSEYEPSITFFNSNEGGNYHYRFRSNLSLNIVKEDGEEQTGYWIIGQLEVAASCYPNRSRVLDVFLARDRELKQAMKNLVSQFMPMERNIIQHEKERPSPPRDPELNIQIEKDFISPLEKESRVTEVYAKVFDCRGRQVCDKTGEGQPVLYQDEIERLDLKNKCCELLTIKNFKSVITNKKCENEGEYKLEKGTDAEKKNIRFITCRLGSWPPVVVDKELIIRGLNIEVKPDRSEIPPDEHTDIVITFSETEPGGAKHPVAGKDIQVEVTGIEDGTIKARDGYTTNSEGKVVLDYKAGDLDEKITVRAWFEPPEYPDKVEDKASVTVKPQDHVVSLKLKASFQWKDNSTSHYVEGIATMNVRGGMKFDQRYRLPMVKRYIPDTLQVGWSFKETLKDLDGSPDCPELVQELSGVGSTAIPDPELRDVGFLEIRKFGEILEEQQIAGFIPQEAKDQLADQFMLVLPAAKQRLRGSVRASSLCGEDNCPCKQYNEIDREIGVGSIAIRGKIETEGSITGSQYWVAQGSTMRTLGFQVNEIGKEIEFQPPVLRFPEGKLINISVSWEITIND